MDNGASPPRNLQRSPAHLLVVHAVVVLVPLALLGGLIVVAWAAADRRYGWLVVAVAAVATATIPVATSTGEGLEHRLPRTAALETHAHLGDELLVYVVGLLVALAAFVYLHHRNSTARARARERRPHRPGWQAAHASPPRCWPSWSSFSRWSPRSRSTESATPAPRLRGATGSTSPRPRPGTSGPRR
jgi:hypothetical protein